MATTDDVLTTLQSMVSTLADTGNAQLKLVPSNSSGQLAATKIVQTGFVRVTGISVVVGGAVGALHDVAATADIAAGNQLYVVPITVGFYPMNLVFPTGLAYVPGAAQKIAIMYTRL